MRQFVRQGLQPIARQHELLHVRAFSKLCGQFSERVVGEDEPPQEWRQSFGQDMRNAVGLETDHAELRALA